jgi:hypothetical protein
MRWISINLLFLLYIHVFILLLYNSLYFRDRRDHDHMQSVPITTKVVSSNPAHDKLYLIQHYVIKVVSDLWQVAGLRHQ